MHELGVLNQMVKTVSRIAEENRIAAINISMHHFDSRPKFLKSKLGMKTQLYGTLCIVLQQLFQNGSDFSFLDNEN